MPQEDTPQQVPQEEQNPYDTSGEEQDLKSLLEELESVNASIDENFANYAAERMDNTPELEELFFNDKKQFVATLLKLQQEFLEKEIGQRQQRASELSDSIAKKRAGGEYQKAKNEFAKEFPDENPDELIAFAKESIPPKKLQELQQLSPLEFLKAVKVFKDTGGSENGSAQASLPKAMNAQAGDVLENSPTTRTQNSVFNRL